MRRSIHLLSVWLFAATALAASGPRDYLKRGEDWFAGPDAAKAAANLLSHQSKLGGWPKNVDTTASKAAKPSKSPTFDNHATVNELRFLARLRRATGDSSNDAAFLRGLGYILNAQYPTGGWPQTDPPPRNYQRHITFNDDAMVNLLRFIRDVATDDLYAFVPADRRKACTTAFDAGIRCILKCQIVADGKPTAWCAQHDEAGYQPRPARSYELVSLSGSESVGITRLLMSLENPDAATIAAIEGAVGWFEKVKITGYVLEEVADPASPGGSDLRWRMDSGAPPLWARFYEIGSNRAMFCDRDGVVKYKLSEIGHERRNGYAWARNWAQRLLEREYPEWKARVRASR